MKTFLKLSFLFGLSLFIASCSQSHQSQPNIVIILADDMGYGDVQSFNPESSVPTPHLNKLSEGGLMFVDAHTPSSICTPTRYGLLTGRYCWRSRLKKGVLKGYDVPLIENDRPTIASYLKEQGYRTGIVGKWHLGLGFEEKGRDQNGKTIFDLTQTLKTSPNNNGFDYSFVLPASLDFEPYLYVKNYDVVDTQFDSVPTTEYPFFWREGLKSRSLDFVDVMDDLLAEAKSFIQREAKNPAPFFLYFPLTAPHKPVIPAKQFTGTSGKGLYGDFVSQVDWTAGEIVKLLRELQIEENTLIIFTSDNGSPMYRIDEDEGPDHVSDETLAFYNASSHKANANLRGIKGDAYEGGHRVPFIVSWPGRIDGNKKLEHSICLTDIYSTIIELTGGSKNTQLPEDSYSFYPLMADKEISNKRPPIIHHSGNGTFAIRDGNWKMIFSDGSGARTKPVGRPFREPFQLYDLQNDLSESKNLIEVEKEVADRLTKELELIRE